MKNRHLLIHYKVSRKANFILHLMFKWLLVKLLREAKIKLIPCKSSVPFLLLLTQKIPIMLLLESLKS